MAKAYLPSIPVEQYPHLHGLSVEIIEGRHDGIQRFEFALNLILDGLETLLSAVDQPPSGSS